MQEQKSINIFYGGFFVRLAAYIIDCIIIGTILLIVQIPIGILSILLPKNFIVIPILFQFSARDIIIYLLTITYFTLLTYFTGSTLGKKLFRLQVVAKDGGRPSFFNILYRESIGRYLSRIILFIGYFMIGIDQEKKSLHDWLCDTRVIYNYKVKNAVPNDINKGVPIIEKREETYDLLEKGIQEENMTEKQEYYTADSELEKVQPNEDLEDNEKLESSEKI